MELDFDSLEPSDFEEFVFSLLDELGFRNLDWRRGTPKGGGAPDDARDIEGDFLAEEFDGETRLERWFTDCKHYGSGVPASALEDSVAWAMAERPAVLLFAVSGFLSNPAKRWLENYVANNRPAFRIKIWERPQIESLASDKRDLVSRFLLRSGTRSEAELVAAESDFFDLIWYDRHRLIRAKRAEAGENWEPKLLETAEAAARAIQSRHGIEKLGPYDAFGWGMLNGKLSALRWMLGEEWDMLDT